MNRIIVIGLVVGSLTALACNAPINLAPSAEPTLTMTLAITDTPLATATLDATATPRPVRPDATPTLTHTPTETPLSLDEVTLRVSDLPNGFAPFNDDAMDDLSEDIDGEYFYEIDHIFAYGRNLEVGGEIIFGFPVTFPTDDPFGDAVDPDDQVDKGLHDLLTRTEITGKGELTRLGGIGEEAVGYFAEALSSEDNAFRAEVIAFRRGTSGVYLYHWYPADYEPDASIADLAFLLDARLQEALSQ